MIVVCRDVLSEGPVVCIVLEIGTVGERSVVCGVLGLLGVPEVVWTSGLLFTPIVVVFHTVVGGSVVDHCCVVLEGCVKDDEVVSVKNEV